MENTFSITDCKHLCDKEESRTLLINKKDSRQVKYLYLYILKLIVKIDNNIETVVKSNNLIIMLFGYRYYNNTLFENINLYIKDASFSQNLVMYVLASKSIESIEGIIFLFSFGYSEGIKEDIKGIFCHKNRQYMSLFDVDRTTFISELNTTSIS